MQSPDRQDCTLVQKASATETSLIAWLYENPNSVQKAKRPMRISDQISSFFWFVAGIGITLLSIKYEFGTFLSPGAGFITFFAGILLSLLSIILFISSLKSGEPRKRLRMLWEGLEWKKVIYVIGLLFVYTVVLKYLGFLISTFLLLSFLFRVKASYHWLRVIIMSFLITTGAFLLFQIWLQVQLPKGILEGII